jgi:chemotaxis protein MotB
LLQKSIFGRQSSLLKRLTILIFLATLCSCVSQRKYNDVYALWVYTNSEYQLLKQGATVNNKYTSFLEKEIERLRRDSAFIDSSFHAYMNLNEKDKAKMKANLDALSLELQKQASRIKLSAKKIAELEALLFRKDSIMRATRERLTEALIGFKDKGVMVHIMGGKVYISLDERLLFQSGKVDVNPAGREALIEIARALNMDTTTNLTIEGHTDDVKYRGKAYKDNWDISVLRATSVVRILHQQGNINPKRFIAAGRAEYYPVDPSPTPEARRKNRRIEIIVTPDLDEIARLLETN